MDDAIYGRNQHEMLVFICILSQDTVVHTLVSYSCLDLVSIFWTCSCLLEICSLDLVFLDSLSGGHEKLDSACRYCVRSSAQVLWGHAPWSWNLVLIQFFAEKTWRIEIEISAAHLWKFEISETKLSQWSNSREKWARGEWEFEKWKSEENLPFFLEENCLKKNAEILLEKKWVALRASKGC